MNNLDSATIDLMINSIWGDHSESDEDIARRFDLQPGDALVWNGNRLLAAKREMKVLPVLDEFIKDQLP